ncbi:hypothetical protein [Aureivirga sp. CE67]|uniref:hypothetical protein n=1 Tax=Aureivirga sp. CE67 TaxID=1788983 RepID=UPI0018C9DE70|nr:hypothetical protein [Aureivirga sp. CE67]
MKKITLLLFFLLFQISFSQTYNTNEIIQKAEFYLKEAVGEDLFSYFKFDEYSYYEYQKRNKKTKFKKIKADKKTKDKLINAEVRFVFMHPDLKKYNLFKTCYIELDEKLNLKKPIDLSRIPKYILKNKSSNWLKETKIDEIIQSQKLKKTNSPIYKQVIFNEKTNTFVWEVRNILFQDKIRYDFEIFYIDCITGDATKPQTLRTFVAICY